MRNDCSARSDGSGLAAPPHAAPCHVQVMLAVCAQLRARPCGPESHVSARGMTHPGVLGLGKGKKKKKELKKKKKASIPTVNIHSMDWRYGARRSRYPVRYSQNKGHHPPEKGSARGKHAIPPCRRNSRASREFRAAHPEIEEVYGREPPSHGLRFEVSLELLLLSAQM